MQCVEFEINQTIKTIFGDIGIITTAAKKNINELKQKLLQMKEENKKIEYKICEQKNIKYDDQTLEKIRKLVNKPANIVLYNPLDKQYGSDHVDEFKLKFLQKLDLLIDKVGKIEKSLDKISDDNKCILFFLKKTNKEKLFKGKLI